MTEPIPQNNRPVSPAETIISLAVLLALVIIAVIIYRLQFNYDPDLYNLDPALLADTAAQPDQPAVDILRRFSAQSDLRTTSVQSFNADNLWEKINGKDQAFFAFNFQRLDLITCTLPDNPALTFDIFLYDMGHPHNAFGIFAQFRAPEDPDWDQPDILGVAAPNGIFFIKGPWYVNLIGSAVDPDLNQAIAAAARTLVQLIPGPSRLPEPFHLLPSENRLPHSLGYRPDNAFATDFLDRVYTADLELDDNTLTAWVSPRDNPGQARQLLDRLKSFWLDIDGRLVEPLPADLPPSALLIDLYGRYELVFTHDHILAGITKAPSPELAARLARRFAASLSQTAGASHD